MSHGLPSCARSPSTIEGSDARLSRQLAKLVDPGGIAAVFMLGQQAFAAGGTATHREEMQRGESAKHLLLPALSRGDGELKRRATTSVGSAA